ncbi:hypothetical protein D065_04428 [Streptococcus mitis 13/39]|uniref:YolD-like protein n=1 Tax=Streptococcus mitis 13/39 TaxID=1239793 RepID=R0NRY6_STRMT|nr:hypothetical protein D065_04428 [Streptococcus mitis 13/39]
MMNRSYLPFESARLYQDRGMAKWMGFFLSEHSSSLWAEKNKEDISISMSMEEKILLVRQLYTNEFPATFVCKLSNRRKVVSGIVKEMGRESISIKSDFGFFRLKWEDILDIQIEGVDLYES